MGKDCGKGKHYYLGGFMSKQARKQRKERAKTPLHKRRKQIASHLSKELRGKYKRRAITVRKGDTVKILRGEFAGHVEKVSDIDTSSRKIFVEGITLTKADGKKVARPIDPSNIIITKLDLSDRYRREILGEKEEEVEIKAPATAAPSPAKSESKEEKKEDVSKEEVSNEEVSKKEVSAGSMEGG